MDSHCVHCVKNPRIRDQPPTGNQCCYQVEFSQRQMYLFLCLLTTENHQLVETMQELCHINYSSLYIVYKYSEPIDHSFLECIDYLPSRDDEQSDIPPLIARSKNKYLSGSVRSFSLTFVILKAACHDNPGAVWK